MVWPFGVLLDFDWLLLCWVWFVWCCDALSDLLVWLWFLVFCLVSFVVCVVCWCSLLVGGCGALDFVVCWVCWFNGAHGWFAIYCCFRFAEVGVL